ncbi:MAG TPA: cell wall hydrolase, partial [Terricaulis sp.]|nr:cell wall hydrolase [Terricaulis sp.]
ICEVVYQGSTRVTGCQFTFTCDGSLGQRPRGRAWDRAQRVATAMMLGYHRPITQNATHYHTHEVNPVWNSGLVETTNIGSHVFYRFPNRAERATYQQALAERRAASRRYIVPRADEEAASPDVELDSAAEVTDAAAIVTAPAPADQPAPAAPAATDTEA